MKQHSKSYKIRGTHVDIDLETWGLKKVYKGIIDYNEKTFKVEESALTELLQDGKGMQESVDNYEQLDNDLKFWETMIMEGDEDVYGYDEDKVERECERLLRENADISDTERSLNMTEV